MYHEVDWTPTRIKEFKIQGQLTEKQCLLLDMRVNDEKIFKQARELDVSDRTINRMVNKLKQIYDGLSLIDDITFPARKIKNTKQTCYSDFKGLFYITRKDTMEIAALPFDMNEFECFEELKKYIIDCSSEIFNKKFYDINELELDIAMKLKIKNK